MVSCVNWAMGRLQGLRPGDLGLCALWEEAETSLLRADSLFNQSCCSRGPAPSVWVSGGCSSSGGGGSAQVCSTEAVGQLARSEASSG